ncbi:SdrD B-like domain-containing protein [Ideonella livida]|uniref:SD-repeat containing protein B domain-containing protein n=1 Tax=Ideonella livida TaxID=2707176 RepID=A0A7C9PJC0_9BURK|nr:SdrD B-like domain-containing protein [Ideonella livida]NDY93457.1 hypothetical protein [Ideonella livida]
MKGLRVGPLVCLLVGAVPAWGQGPAAPSPAAPAYVDRVMADLPPSEDEEDAPEAPYDPSGPPRYLRVEARVGTEPFDARHRTRSGVVAQALLETASFGLLSLDGALPGDARRATLTLRQRDLPLADGWRAHHELGVVDRPAPPVTRLPTRITVPSFVVGGAALQWEQPERGWWLQAAQGEAGRLQGAPVTLFDRLGGQRSLLALQSRQAPGPGQGVWTTAMMLETAENVLPTGALGAARQSARSGQTVVRLEQGPLSLQTHTVRTHQETLDTVRDGFWLDGQWREGPRQHSFGAYRLAPGLSWVDQPLPEDLEGVYYRGQWRGRLWSVEGALDGLHNLSGRHGDGFYAATSGRWRLSRDHSLGAGLTLRRYAGQATQGHADWRWQHELGATGLRLEHTDSQDGPRRLGLSWDQEWALPLGQTLASSLAHARESAFAPAGLGAQSLWNAALAWTLPLGSRAQWNGSLQTQRSSAGQDTWSANLGTQWRLAPLWTLEGLYTRSLGRLASAVPLDPLAPRPTDAVATASRAFLLVLRHEFQAGSRSVPLGGQPQAGGGRVQGVVYFDANRSGTQDASEAGVPGVMVTLDERYVTRTDAQGRFEFPLVAAGGHTLAVRSDSLPLPWSAADETGQRVEVQLRGDTRVALAVQRAP